MITYNIHVLMGAGSNEISTTVKCHDTGVNLRVFPETMTKLSARRFKTDPYTIPSGSVAVLKVVKSDRTYVLTDAKRVEQNSVFFELPPQTFTVSGKASAEVNIFGPDGRRITSGTFFIDVSKECADDSAEESKNYVDVMSMQIKAAIDAASRAEEAAKQASAGGATDEQLEKAIKAYFDKNPGAAGSKAIERDMTVYADKWEPTEHAEEWAQVVEIDGVTVYSQVDVKFNSEQYEIFSGKEVYVFVINRNGVTTAYVQGQKLQNDYTFKVTLTEVYDE